MDPGAKRSRFKSMDLHQLSGKNALRECSPWVHPSHHRAIIETNTILHFMFDTKLPGGSGLGLAEMDGARARQKKRQRIEIYPNPFLFFGTVGFPTQYIYCKYIYIYIHIYLQDIYIYIFYKIYIYIYKDLQYIYIYIDIYPLYTYIYIYIYTFTISIYINRYTFLLLFLLSLLLLRLSCLVSLLLLCYQ